MMVGAAPFHLTYSTNVHPADRWAEVRAVLERFVLPRRQCAVEIVDELLLGAGAFTHGGSP